jgi:hypothetical protein
MCVAQDGQRDEDGLDHSGGDHTHEQQPTQIMKSNMQLYR